MKSGYRFAMGVTIALAFIMGFLHFLWPEGATAFRRLHIFLFNLCAGGALILFYTEGGKTVSRLVIVYFLLSLAYAFCASFKLYIPTLILSLPLIILVEWVRIRRFSFFPTNFFSRTAPVSEKFNQASLLCLSMGIVIASLVILNNQYLDIVRYKTLTIEVFFLGYSFPISLITMSIMFSFMTVQAGRWMAFLKEASFWLVNMGVVIFFVFIIFGVLSAEMTIAIILFFTVSMVFILFLKGAPQLQQKTFLISGMCFLLFTGLTGILYIFRYFSPAVDSLHDYFLNMHAMVSLYGWNISGLFIILRSKDFPIKLNSGAMLVIHWITILILAPLATRIPGLSIPTVLGFLLLLGIALLSRGKGHAQLGADKP